MDCHDAVLKWKTIAAAFHAGALNHCATFETTEEVIRHLSGCKDQELTACTEAISRTHQDFYYHGKDIPGPFGLSSFFRERVGETCVLCKNIRVTKEGRFTKTIKGTGRFKCKTSTTDNVSPRSVQGKDLNLLRLEHLAVVHTPYFVMLFLDLVKSKHYSVHKDSKERREIASYVIEQLKGEDASTLVEGYNPARFLQLWWRFQEKRSARKLKVSIPLYLKLYTDKTTWSPKDDTFEDRQPEPLYTFLAKYCLCHNIWQNRGVVTSSKNVDQWPRIKKLTKDQVSTFLLSVLTPRLHVENILNSAANACNDRQAVFPGRGQASTSSHLMDCCSPLAPMLDCLMLEDVDSPSWVMMHVVTTLSFQWLTLSSWMASMREKTLDRHLALNIKKVSLGVMGSLRDICLQDKRPPSCFYAMTKDCEPKLTKAFFVHSETGDVLSLLPFISLPRMYRTSNSTKEEDNFHTECGNVALCMLYAHKERNMDVCYKRQKLKVWWETEGLLSDNPYRRPANVPCLGRWDKDLFLFNILEFCKTGLVNDNMWAALGPKEAGSRGLNNADVSAVWLGTHPRTDEALRGKLLTLGLREPLRVSIIEIIREPDLSNIHGKQQGFSTHKPELNLGLISLLTVEKWRPRQINLSCNRAMGCIQMNKRSNSSVDSEVAPKMYQGDTIANALLHIRTLNKRLGDELASSSGSAAALSTERAVDAHVDVQYSNRNVCQVDCDMETMEEPPVDISEDIQVTVDPTPIVSFSTEPAQHLSSSLSDELTISLGCMGALPTKRAADTHVHVQYSNCPEPARGSSLEQNEHMLNSDESNNLGPLESDIDPLNVIADFYNTGLTDGSAAWIMHECSEGTLDKAIEDLSRILSHNSWDGTVDNLSGQSQYHEPQLQIDCNQQDNQAAEQPEQYVGGINLDPSDNRDLTDFMERQLGQQLDSFTIQGQDQTAQSVVHITNLSSFDLVKAGIYLYGESQYHEQQPQIMFNQQAIQMADQTTQDLLQLDPNTLWPMNPDMNHQWGQSVYTTIDPSQIVEAVALGEPTLNVYQIPEPGVMGELVALGEPARVEDDREANAHEKKFFRKKKNSRWKSSGFEINTLKSITAKPYKTMTYVSCDSIANSKKKDITMRHTEKTVSPLTNLCVGLAEPLQHHVWVKPKDLSPVDGVVRTDPNNHKLAWENGVESRSAHTIILCSPNSLIHNKKIPCHTVSCREEPQTYQMVNLAKPPNYGFKHVELKINEYPIKTGKVGPKLPKVEISEVFYLGAVCTIHSVSGMLMHKIFATKACLLRDMLDMHTCLQVHPFVPRIFTLQLAKTPLVNQNVVGVFIGEAAGEWNLGCAEGMQLLTETEKFTLAYHVMQCLLRAQILSLTFLEFTMKCIQPARIWRWQTGFRLDFLGCLADTIHVWDNDHTMGGAKEGLTVIQVTMKQLGLFHLLPVQVRDILEDTSEDSGSHQAPTNSNCDNEDLLHKVYKLCAFAEQQTSGGIILDPILSSDCYEDIQLHTDGSHFQPFGPFHIMTHHQPFYWNEAIIVEPVLNETPKLAKVFVLEGTSHKATGRRAKGKRVSNRGSLCDQNSASATVSNSKVMGRAFVNLKRIDYTPGEQFGKCS